MEWGGGQGAGRVSFGCGTGWTGRVRPEACEGLGRGRFLGSGLRPPLGMTLRGRRSPVEWDKGGPLVAFAWALRARWGVGMALGRIHANCRLSVLRDLEYNDEIGNEFAVRFIYDGGRRWHRWRGCAREWHQSVRTTQREEVA